FHDQEESTTRIASSQPQTQFKRKDKGKAKLVEEPKIPKSRKKQIQADAELAKRLKAEFEEE
ncbi:hypothetical protein Tco_0651420, partial [Tanacetum coccineum]